MTPPLSVALAALLAWSGGLLVIRFAERLQLMAPPLGPAQSAHLVAKPTSGGLSIVAACYLLLGMQALAGGLQFARPGLLAVPFALACLGLLDDRRPLPAWLRLVVHFGCGVWLLFCLQPASPTDLPGWFWAALLLPAFVWMVNLMNFMDGMDGLAAAQAVFVLLGLMLLDASLLPVALPALGACLGFLLLNLPPARIFMGDLGSGFLGALLGVLLLFGITRGELTPGGGLILIALFATDASWTLLRRALRGRKLTEGHREHAYQKAADLYGPGKTLLAAQLINYCWLLPLALLTRQLPGADLWLAVPAFLPLLALCLYLEGGLPRRGQVGSGPAARPRGTLESPSPDG